MSDIRFNQWLHQSGTGGVSQVASGAVGVGTTNPLADFYVRGDAQITGILTAGHIAMGSSITFGDNDRIYLGDGTDFQLYHASSDNNSYIVESGAGSLVVNASKFHVKNAANNEDIAVFNQSGNNELYFSNSKKFETTNTGAVVTGILTATSFSGGLPIPNEGNDRIITSSGSGAVNAEANLQFDGTNLFMPNELRHLGDPDTKIGFDTDTIKFETAGGERLRITSAGKVGINKTSPAGWLHIHQADSGTTDGIVITNTSTTNNGLMIGVSSSEEAFFWNGSNTSMNFATNNTERLRITNAGLVGIGDNSPDRELVVKNASSNATVKIEASNAHTSQLFFSDTDAENVARISVFHGSGQATSNSLIFDTAGTTRLMIDTTGTSTFNGFIESVGTSGRGAKLGNISVGYGNLYNTVQSLANSTNLHLQYNVNGDIKCNEGGGDMYTRDIIPQSNNSYDLGTNSYRWRNIHTNDLNLSNEGNVNEVDGTWGQYTIQEGENDLFLINRRNGKRYKFNLTEVD